MAPLQELQELLLIEVMPPSQRVACFTRYGPTVESTEASQAHPESVQEGKMYHKSKRGR